MKLLFAAASALTMFLSGLVGLNSPPPPTVTSIHAFEEPLVAIDGDKSADQDSALIAALQTYKKRKSYDDVSAITTYLDANPNSPWKFSILANLGTVYRKAGYFSRAIDAWEKAWALGKGEKKDVQVQALANQVAANLATLLSSLGRSERLGPLLTETKGRNIYGSAWVQLNYAAQNSWQMKNYPGDSFKCGPYALDSIRTFARRKDAHHELTEKAQSGTKGFSLVQVRDLSNQLKMNYQMAKRQPGTPFIIPSVVHWKSGHYAALLKKQGDFYLTKDPTFGQDLLVTAQALEDEASGYFLVPSGPLPSGWQAVSDTEGKTVWGRGLLTNRSATATTPLDIDAGCQGGGSTGMAVYRISAMLVNLSIQDTPVGYKPPVGPDMHFKITYNQLEYSQPAASTAFNFGPQWNCSWLSYVSIPTSTGATTTVNVRGGGQEIYAASTYHTTGTGGYDGYFGNQIQSQDTLWVVAPVLPSTTNTYERRMPDGSKEIFGEVDPAGHYVFLTEIIDPQGNAVTLGYDHTSSYYTTDHYTRLRTITDAASTPLTTTLTYGLSADPLKVTEITDPFGRSATFSYTTSSPYQLTSIQDVVGITSSFAYASGTSNITSMTTPYGTTSFTASTSGTTQILNVVEPDGGQVQAESHIDGTGYPYSTTGGTTAEPVPSGDGFDSPSGDTWLAYRNTFYWDKKAMALAGNAPDSYYSYAYIYHFLHTPNGGSIDVESPVLESEKPALENRIWYNYPNQDGYTIYEGTSGFPTAVARVLPDGVTTQCTQYQYNNTLNPAVVTARIDPAGRQTNYTYDTTAGIDLTGVTQNKASGTDTLFSATYDSHHRPLTTTDAAGETTTYTYNSKEQVASIEPPVRSGHSAETTTYSYTDNFLTSITGPMSGATKTFTYDTLGGQTVNRVKTVADAESYTLTYSYDNLDRVTQILYPDSTTETFSYLNPTTSAVDLDLHSSTDRLGHTTTRVYDSVRHMTSITDPLSQTTHYHYCSCGALDSIQDPKGNYTYLNRDLENRLTSKVYSGETQPPTLPDYTFDALGRVATFKDKRGDVATYSYNLDDTVSGVSYSLASGTATTPSVSYGYDTYYNRPTSIGGVSFSYVSAGSLGALKPLTVTNTMTGGSAAITYTYDEWGRVVGRNIDSADNETTAFDSLGRVTSIVNALCPSSTSFGYSYFDPTHPTNRIGTISYPNGQSTVYNYFGNTGDERLEEIKNETPASAVLSQNDYTYFADGKIETWQQQTDSNIPTLWTEGYDAANQLTSAVLTNTQISSPAVRSDSYGYDAAGNATTFNVSGVSRSPSYNALNQLTGSTPSGSRTVGFTGSVNGADTVTVNGSSATVNTSHYFSGSTSFTPGTTNMLATVPVVATDTHGNVRTNNYQTTVPAELTYSPTFDADGNELTNGAGQSYMWDAKNELITITYTGGATSNFTYDALERRIKIVEKNSGGTVTSTKQLVWNGSRIAEERNASNAVTKKFFAQGEQIGSSSFYYSKDHLGSVREMCDSSGTIQARYDYDPYGRTTLVSGTNLSDFQYAGYYAHQPSGLNLTLFRAYDPNTAKWLSRDPLPFAEVLQGPNLYEYVGNEPTVLTDPMGTHPPNPAAGNPGYQPPNVGGPSGIGMGAAAVGSVCFVGGLMLGPPGWVADALGLVASGASYVGLGDSMGVFNSPSSSKK